MTREVIHPAAKVGLVLGVSLLLWALIIAAVLLVINATKADAATTSPRTVSNSSHSQWNIGTWSDPHCGNGHIHLVAPGHHRSGVRSIKAYGKHNVLHRPGHAPKTLTKRHCYTVTGSGWKVTTTGD